ncbi:MAG: acyl-CoA thioesterase, partial [Bacteroidia bacterium]|nr:acyl-CoA thioesterase [Bacteroidia bacterium]
FPRIHNLKNSTADMLNSKEKTSKVNIRFSDLDLFGHVNNAVYLTYFEEARVAYFNEVVGYDYDWSTEGVILARVEIDFVIPVHFKDEVFIRTKCCRMGSKSFDLAYEMFIVKEEKEIMLSSATSVMVMYNYKEKKSILVSEEWKVKLVSSK